MLCCYDTRSNLAESQGSCEYLQYLFSPMEGQLLHRAFLTNILAFSKNNAICILRGILQNEKTLSQCSLKDIVFHEFWFIVFKDDRSES